MASMKSVRFGAAPTYFGLITTRHMHEYGTVGAMGPGGSVHTRLGYALNPLYRDPLTTLGSAELPTDLLSL